MVELASLISTVDERRALLKELENFAAALYKPNFDMSRFKQLTSLLQKCGVNSQDVSVASGFIEDIRAQLDIMPVIEITLAFEPGSDFIKRLVAWFRQVLGEQILLHISTDKSILAGVRISYSGLYKDLSLLTRLGSYNFSNLASFYE